MTVAKKGMANGLTVSRMVLSAVLLFLPSHSRLFVAFYLVCGATDVLDGFVARKTHTESERGARLDSAADLAFAVAVSVKVLPALRLPLWILFWTAAIAVCKGAGILLKSRKTRGIALSHSLLNKLTGLAAFLLPLTVSFVNVTLSAALVCAVATAATAQEWLVL